MTLKVMLKKEVMGFWRTYKLLILAVVFLLFAFMSPLSAKFMPEILSLVLPKEIAESFPEPTAVDSWAQFFKNFSQMGLFVLTIIFANSLIHERVDGTLTILLTKGLRRRTVYLAKLLLACGMWTVLYWIAFGITYFYTWYYFRDDVVENLFVAVGHLWLFGLLLLAIIFLGNVLFKSIFGNLLFVGGFVVVLFILSIFPKLEKYNPLVLASDNVGLLQVDFAFSDYGWVYGISIFASFLCTVFGIWYFGRKEV